MRNAATRLAMSLMLSTALSTGVAWSQASSELDRLLGGNTAFQSMRSIDPSTRASKRYAVVIGNSDYATIPDLANAHADSDVMAEFFRSQGYVVQQHKDITKRGFEDVLRRVLFDVDKDTEVVVFFAGHGFQIGSENYLVPTDADLDSIYDVPFEAVSLGSLVGIVGARARLQVVMLDSCRDNPFAGKSALTRVGNELREARTGFSSQAAPLNSMMVFSTAPGALAYDGEGENSPFTAAVIEEVNARPDALVKDVFVDVRRSVFEKTSGRQVPWESSTLVEPASFGIAHAMSRPIKVSSTGLGESRGLARIVPVAADTAQDVTPVADAMAVLDVDFVPEVEIGFALRNALDLTPADTVTLLDNPETGRLVLPDETGFQRDIRNVELTSAEVDQLILINESVQIPATRLENGIIDDVLRVSVGGVDQKIALQLKPAACDFEAGDHLDPDGMGLTRYANEIRPEVALKACEAAVREAPEIGRFHYQMGRALIALRRTAEAKAAFETARDLGHARAWQALANARLNEERETGGAGNPQASEEVLQLFAEGVERGDPYAFYSLGRQFMRFGGTDAIEVEGYDLMMRALEVGHTFAMNELGYFYLDEAGEFYDAERGLRYLRESAEREDIYGFNNMGLVYLKGLGGTEPDYPAAFDMFQKAADGGHPNAPFNLARMYRDGLVGSGPDREAAIAWYKTGLERGDAYSGGNAAILIVNEGVEGYDAYDAAVFAAKASALTNQKFSNKTKEILKALPVDVVDGGAQKLMIELGAELEIDGQFGAGSQAILDEILASQGVEAAAADPVERVIQLAALVWKSSPFRVDLY